MYLDSIVRDEIAVWGLLGASKARVEVQVQVLEPVRLVLVVVNLSSNMLGCRVAERQDSNLAAHHSGSTFA